MISCFSSSCEQHELFASASVPTPASDGSATLARLVSEFASEVSTGASYASLAALQSRINDAAFLGRLSTFRRSLIFVRLSARSTRPQKRQTASPALTPYRSLRKMCSDACRNNAAGALRRRNSR